MSANSSDIVHQGWLTKSPPAKGIFRPRWRRRWFLLRAGTFPNQFVLEYFTDESCRRPKGQINLDECERIAAPLAVQDRHKFTFDLRTPNRTYYLAADSEAEMNKWVTCLCHVCGLKTMDDENDRDENNKPEESQEHIDSDDSSPTLSARVPSGPYIPISECFTGKPILFNDKPNGQEATYCNTTSFPFPPKVNWETHPTKKECTESESTAAHSDNSPVAPPRPPKKHSSNTATQSSTRSTEIPKTILPTTGTSAVFHYDNLEEVHDSSSNCSSLHSPPGSAGVLYSNISEIMDSKAATGPIYQNPANLTTAAGQMSQMNPLPSPGDPNGSNTSPPKVDRNLKPDLRKLSDASSRTQPSQSNKIFTHKHSSGSMTLPTRSSQRQPIAVGPVIDRSRKPSDSPSLTLGPTPAQVKFQSGNQISSLRYNPGRKSSTSTLPTSPPRRAGPMISPHDKKPQVLHEYEQAPELLGTYLQIDCKAKEGDKSHNNPKVISRNIHTDDSGSVEYRLIDHVKTKALNQMRQDRAEQLRTNTVTKNLI